MRNKKYVILIIILAILSTTIAYFESARERIEDENSTQMIIPTAYAYLTKNQMVYYKQTGKVLGTQWYSANLGETQLKKADERFMIVKVNFGEDLDHSKVLEVRLKYKIAELYIDGKFVDGNGTVATEDIRKNISSYYEFEVPLSKKYESKSGILLLEATNNSGFESFDTVSIVSKDDLFKMFPVYSLAAIFGIYITILISALAALNLYWMRFSYRGKLLQLFLPIWLILIGVSATVPYFPIEYPQYMNEIACVAVICFEVATLMTMYGFKKFAKSRNWVLFWRLLIWFTWMVYANIDIMVFLNIINWCYAQFLIDKIIYILVPVFYVFAIFASMSIDYEFRNIIKIFLTLGAISSTCALIILLKFHNVNLATTVVIITWILSMIYLSSQLINLLHLELNDEVDKGRLDNDIFQSIEFSRDDILNTSKLKNKKEFNNFSTGYVQGILGMKIHVVSMILRPKEDGNVEIVYSKNNFGKYELAPDEALFYISKFKLTFTDPDKTCVVNGTRANLGFENDGLYYYMVIKAEEEIEELKEKALQNYAVNIRDTTNNFVITRYVEQARSDVIKSFGTTIEKRIRSNNIIDVTDTFIVFVARALEKSEDEVQVIKTASYLINIGSIIMGEELITNYHLMDEIELEMAKHRAIYGYRILKDFNDQILQMAAKVSLQQFENYDGTGYFGLRRNNISEETQVISIAIAMTSVFRKSQVENLSLFEQCMNHLEEEYSGAISANLITKLRNKRLVFETTIRENEKTFYDKVETIKKIDDLII